MVAHHLSFRLNNQNHKVRLHDICEGLHLPVEGRRWCDTNVKWDPTPFWHQISRPRLSREGVEEAPRPFNGRYCKAALIYNPALRYVQKLLAGTIFGRGDS